MPDGTEQSNSDYESSNYIEVNEGELYLVTNSTGGYPDMFNQRSSLTGVVGYDTNKNAICVLENQLSGTQQVTGRHIAKDYIIKIPSGIEYIRATSAYKTSEQSYQSSPLILYKIINNGYNGVDYSAEYVMPSIVNGTQANPANAYAVCTDFVPVFVGAKVSCKVIKPYQTNTNYYCFGFATYDADKNVVRNFNYNSESYNKSSAKIEDGEYYIKFSVCEYNSAQTAVVNRIADFENYPITIYVCGERAVLGYTNQLGKRIERLEIDSAPVDVEFNVITGKYVDFYTGDTNNSNDYDCSDFIPVVPGEHYIYTGVLGANYSSSAVGGGAYYDSNKAYLCGAISQMSAIGASGSRHLINGYRFEIPSGAAYMRVSSAARNSASGTYPKSNIILKKYDKNGIWAKTNDGDDVLVTNNDMEGAIKAAAKINWFNDGYREYYTTKKYNLTLAIISDMHGAYNNFDRFAQYVNTHTDEIDVALSLGDIVLSEPMEGLFTFPNTVKKFSVPFMYVVGNHDTADTGLSAISESQCRARYYNDIISNGFMSAEDFGGTGKCYWYKDFATYKIRIVALFEYGNSEELATNAPSSYCRRWIDSTQLQWFADTLYSTPTDYSVIVLTHQMPWYPMTLDSGLFTQNPSALTSGTFLNTQDGRVVGDVINAFIHGTSLSETYNPIDGYGLSKTATVTKDFSSRGVGNFICNICGHVHGSYIAHDTEYTDQLTIAVPSGASSPYQQQYSDIPVTDTGRNIDRFYVIGIDTVNKNVNIIEIGAQDTLKMEKRNQICVSYGE